MIYEFEILRLPDNHRRAQVVWQDEGSCQSRRWTQMHIENARILIGGGGRDLGFGAARRG
ncbi:hypothetical protein FGG78_09105 [Thioclava sp. BHET1]|nr:hypothetical protein FGG78_09105 [Thioclava sp. BHET1]